MKMKIAKLEFTLKIIFKLILCNQPFDCSSQLATKTIKYKEHTSSNYSLI